MVSSSGLHPLLAFLLALVRFSLEDFGRRSSHSDNHPSGGHARHYNCLCNRNFVMQICEKRGLTTNTRDYYKITVDYRNKWRESAGRIEISLTPKTLLNYDHEVNETFDG